MTEAKRIYAVGASGCGKSTLMDAMAAPSRRLIVFDYLESAGAIKRQRNLKLTRVRSLREVKEIVARGYTSSFRIWYQPPIDDQIAALHELSIFLWNVQHLARFQPVTLYVDEIADSFPIYSLPADRRGFYRLCKAGRHIGVNVLGASQKPSQVNSEFRGNLDAVYVFRLPFKADQQAVRAIGGAPVERFSQTTPKYRYCRIGEGGTLTYGQTRP